MKIIFLDFDGVLNSSRFFKEQTPKGVLIASPGLDPKAVEVLNEIIERSGAMVVVSSAWRIGSSVVRLRGTLGEVGFRGKVRGLTPNFNTAERGREIQTWLDEDGKRYGVSSFVIIDDMGYMGLLQDRLVQTDFETGLLPEHIGPALAQLDRPI